jgi:endo-1,4-beta-D-glucanase Y
MRFTKLFLFFCLLYLLPFLLCAQNIRKPFPQHVQYYTGTIKPNHIPQQEMDDSVQSFYLVWKERYINNDCGQGQYYVWFEKDGGTKKCVSEGQGYGMTIVALMAGFDTAAKTIYDGLYYYYKAHQSNINPHLMSWAQDKNFKDAATSATDGDLDIAYSLLLANAQWGSSGTVNYLSAAQEIINAIMQHEINPKTFSVLLSDAVEQDSHDYFDTRSSDFMPAHCKAFKNATGDTNWDKVIDNNYKLFDFLQNKYSSEAGLVPDFITHINTSPKPAPAHYLESRYDGYYNYNACRVPWRIATDFIINGDKRSEKFIEKINAWIKETTQQNPDNISAGYNLNGDDLKSRNFEALSFIAPFAVAAMINGKNQLWLNKIWDYIIHFTLDEFDYYDNTIKMVNLIILSGNYLAP